MAKLMKLNHQWAAEATRVGRAIGRADTTSVGVLPVQLFVPYAGQSFTDLPCAAAQARIWC